MTPSTPSGIIPFPPGRLDAVIVGRRLKVRCELDTRAYPKGIKVSDEEMDSLNIKGDAFHPEWNYTISPRPP